LVPANCFADPKLGSISSLRCQKSRTRIPKDTTCEVMFRGRFERRLVSRALCRSSIPSGGARRDRTDDLMLAKHALSQLSYGPVPEDECSAPPVVALRAMPGTLHSIVYRGCATRSHRRSVVGLGRLELPTSRLSSARSNQLSYKPLTRGAAMARSRLTPDASHKR
jgi:hypothetical protein